MKKQTNKYTRLVSNTVLFAISTFSSKALSFLLTRLYTGVLPEASFGVVDLVTASANLLIPLVSLGISTAVIRFGLEKSTNKSSVFTAGIAAIGIGFGVLLLLFPLLRTVPLVSEHVVLLYGYVLVSCLRTLCCQFVRARLYTRLYAVDGILSTAYTVGLNILFLVVLKMGPTGYLLSIICADALSVLGLSLFAVLWQYVDFRRFDRALFAKMLRYCLPLVPALMFWWVNNASDRFFISFLSGPAENGLYAAAYKVPTIVAIMSTIFTEAWQLSAVTDGQGEGREDFFSNIYSALNAVVFMAGGVLIFGCRLIMRLLVAPDYFIAWRYIPLLMMATVFSCLVSFFNSVYMVEKKTTRSLSTMLIGALANLALNALFIPRYGPQGAALATFLSYFLVFLLRAVNIQDLIPVRFAPVRTLANTALLSAVSFTAIAAPQPWTLWVGIPLSLMMVVNLPFLIRGLLALWRRRRRKKAPNPAPPPA